MKHAGLAGCQAREQRGIELLIAFVAVGWVMAGYFSPQALGVFAAAMVLWLAAAGFRPLLWIIVFFLPVAPYLHWDLPIKDLATLVRFAFFAGTMVYSRRRGSSLRNLLFGGSLSWAIMIYVLVALLSATLFNAGTGSAARELMRLASYLCFYFSITAWVESDKDAMDVFNVLMVSTIGVVLFGFYQAAIGDYSSVYEALYPFQDEMQKAPPWSGRITSFLGHFNSLAGYLNLQIPIFIGLALRGQTAGVRRLARTCFVLGSIALVLTQSRGALLSYAAILVVAAWVMAPTRAARLGWVSSLLVLTTAAALIVGMIFQRLSGIDEYTEITRLAVWAGAAAVFAGSPLAGIGFGNLRNLLAGVIDLPDDFILDAHNLYLEVLAETGLVGLLAFASLIFAALRTAWRLLRDPAGVMTWIVGFAAFAAIAGTLVHGAVDYMFHTSPQFSAMFFLVLGLLNAARRNQQLANQVAGLP
jgi:putative inorganic carbon (hco3(-)) transporter